MQSDHLRGIIRQQRMSLSITLRELAAASNVSASHLGRIERGECFPSAHVLQRISDPLGFKKTSFYLGRILVFPIFQGCRRGSSLPK
ncbi:MAG: helix-turn-helix transcriptional regulator [Dehalococcoidales bacterium]|nr:helix-turn-helix transcriptional regulator [Dehalococcoidales bacterium]